MLTDASNVRLDLVHPELARRFRLVDSKAPALCLQVTRGLATAAEQAAIYAEGRTTPGPPCIHDGVARPVGTCAEHPFGATVTNAKPGYSAHQFGYAIDVVPEDIQPGQPDWNTEHPAWQQTLSVALDCRLAEGATWRTFKDWPHLYLEELPADPTDQMRWVVSKIGLRGLWNSWDGLLKMPAVDPSMGVD
jgi:peptidoglycan L-alanyl-D-glutamate endopeptidase CwlK